MKHDLIRWSELLLRGQESASLINISQKQFSRVLFVGMGGSGIAGMLVSQLLQYQVSVPFECITSTVVPPYVDEHTLVFVSSYSGNTWETVRVAKELHEKKCTIITLCTGGTLMQWATESDLPVVVVPQSSVPRAALGQYLGALLALIEQAGIYATSSLIAELSLAAEKFLPMLEHEKVYMPFIEMVHEYPIFHTWGVTGDTQSVSYRFQTQCNENADIASVAAQYPELAHNLLVGAAASAVPVVLFATDFCDDVLKVGVDSLCSVLEEYAIPLYKPKLFGDTYAQQVLYAVLWSDFASYYLGIQSGINITATLPIDQLKKTFAQRIKR